MIGNQYAKGNKPNKTSFKKGSTPWNKGISIRVSPTTEFKKGQKGVTWKPVGTISARREETGTRRQWIKISEPNIWIEYAKYIWLKSGRVLEKGMCLHHINNNSLDDRVENLITVTRSDHVKLHNRWNTKNIKISKGVWRSGILGMTSCIHFWGCSRPQGRITHAMCRRCGAERDFPSDGRSVEHGRKKVYINKKEMAKSSALESRREEIIKDYENQSMTINELLRKFRTTNAMLYYKLKLWGIEKRKSKAAKL